MLVIKGLVFQRFKVILNPSDTLVNALIKIYAILPAKLLANLGTVKMVCGILPEAFANKLHMILEFYAQFEAYKFNERTD